MSKNNKGLPLHVHNWHIVIYYIRFGRSFFKMTSFLCPICLCPLGTIPGLFQNIFRFIGLIMSFHYKTLHNEPWTWLQNNRNYNASRRNFGDYMKIRIEVYVPRNVRNKGNACIFIIMRLCMWLFHYSIMLCHILYKN